MIIWTPPPLSLSLSLSLSLFNTWTYTLYLSRLTLSLTLIYFVCSSYVLHLVISLYIVYSFSLEWKCISSLILPHQEYLQPKWNLASCIIKLYCSPIGSNWWMVLLNFLPIYVNILCVTSCSYKLTSLISNKKLLIYLWRKITDF